MFKHQVDSRFPFQLGFIESDPPSKCTEIVKCTLGINALVHSIVELPLKFGTSGVEEICHAVGHHFLLVSFDECSGLG